MQKLLVVVSIGLVAVLLLLWHETHAQVEVPATAARVSAPPDKPTPPPDPTPVVVAPKVDAGVVAAVPIDADDGKVNPNSDEYFERFIERQPKVVSRAAMSCYHGHKLGMDQWLRFTFVGHVSHGEVTFTNVLTKESRLDDPALESCMLSAVRDAHFHDDTLPDTESYPDEVVLNPERGGKKYMHDNSADGDEAPANTPR